MTTPEAGWRAAVRAVPGLRRDLGHVTAFSALTSALMLVPALFSVQVFDRVLASRSVDTLSVLLVMVLLVLAVCTVLDAMRGRLLGIAAQRMEDQLLPRLSRLPHEQPSRAALQSAADLSALRRMLAAPLAAAFELPWLPLYLVVLYLLHPLLGLLGSVGVALVALGMWFQERGNARTWPVWQTAQDALQRAQQMHDRHAPQLLAQGASANLADELHASRDRAATLTQQVQSRAVAHDALLRGLKQALQSGVLALGAWLVLRDEATPGVMIGGVIVLGRMMVPLQAMQSAWRPLREGLQALQRLTPLLEAKAPPSFADAHREPHQAPHLACDEVTLGVPGLPRPLLQGITLDIAPGQSVALIGPGGAGKTLLLHVLLGLTAPSMGQTRIDGHPALACAQRGDSRWGYFGEAPVLEEATIGQLVSRHARSPSIASLEAAARAAGLLSWLHRLPMGWDTPIGRQGLMPSASQTQALALARALYGDPMLLVIDEPGHVADPGVERALRDAIVAAQQRGATVLIATGRRRWARLAPRWLVMRDGRLVADGPRQAIEAQLTTNRISA